MADFTALTVGLNGTARTAVTEDKLATAVGSGNARVFASPMLIALMEAAAVDCVEALLPDGYLTLGTHLDVSHSAPTPEGHSVTATAKLTAIEGRKLTFSVEAHDEREKIGAGTHVRIVVDSPRFLARVAAKSLPRA